MSELRDGEWHRRGVGGRVFLADGLFELSYGPLKWCCLVGITCMGSPVCATTREGGKHRVVSLSASLSSFKREKGMKGHGKYEGM